MLMFARSASRATAAPGMICTALFLVKLLPVPGRDPRASFLDDLLPAGAPPASARERSADSSAWHARQGPADGALVLAGEGGGMLPSALSMRKVAQLSSSPNSSGVQ